MHKQQLSVVVVAFSSSFFPSHATKSVCRSVVCTSFCFFQVPYRGDLCSTSASTHKSVLKSYYTLQSFAAWLKRSRGVCVCDWQVAIMQHAAVVTQGLDCKIVKFGIPDEVISTVPHSARVPLSSRCSLLQRIKTKEFSKCSPGLIGKPPPPSLFFLLGVRLASYP